VNELFRLFGARTASESAMLGLALVVGLLFVMSVVFAAYTVLLRLGHQLREKRWKKLTARWQQPVLHALTDPDRMDAVHAVVEKRYRLHFVQFVLEYIRRVRGEERKTLRALALPYLPLVVARAGHRRPEIRTRAVQTLGTLGLPKYADVVLAALDDPSPLVSMVAARYIAREDFPQYAGAVLAHLPRYRGWNRRFLASMIAAMGPDISRRLRAGLADEDRPGWVRAVLADALLMQLDPMAADVAAKVIVTTEDRELLASTLRLLAGVGRPGHAAVIRARCSSPDFLIRAQALHALGVLSDEEDLPLLERSMEDPSPWVALHAARGVLEAGGRGRLLAISAGDSRPAAVAGQVLAEEDEG
jgi:HEAT repeat protein